MTSGHVPDPLDGYVEWRPRVGSFRYKVSPLQEALCEFGFSPGSEWSEEGAQHLEALLKPTYPVRKTVQTLAAQFMLKGKDIQQGLAHGERAQLLTESQSEMVQLAPNTLTVNQMSPYPGWQDFKPRVQESVNRYLDVFKPVGIFRAHLRYINKIEFEDVEINLYDWFEFVFRKPMVQDLPPAIGFNLAAQFRCSGDAMLKISLADVTENEDKMRFLLDIEFFEHGENVLPFEHVGDWLERAHSTIELAWLGCITEDLHYRYGPEVIT